MALYDYIKEDGSSGQDEATSPDEAIRTAPGIASNSGVSLSVLKSNDTTNKSSDSSGSTGGTDTGKDTNLTLKDRYKNQQQDIQDTFGTLDKPNQESTRDTYRQQAQATINAVNQKYASIEASDRQQADLFNREARASNVMNGLSGGSVGASEAIDASTKGKKLMDDTAAQKAADVAKILADADTRSSEEFQREREAYISQQKDKYSAQQALNDKISTAATAELKQLGNGTTYEDFKAKSPKLVEQYMKELDTDENGVKALFLQGAGANLVSDTPQIIGNKAVFFTKKPDGTIGQTTIDLPDSGKKEIESSRITDSGIQVLYKDGTYAVLGGGVGGGSGSGSTAGYTAQEKRKLRAAGIDSSDIKASDAYLYGNSKSNFTSTQQNKGASNAGIEMTDFSDLDPDTQNYFVNGYGKFNTLLKQVQSGDMDASDLLDLVDSSQTIPESAKQYLKQQVPGGDSGADAKSGDGEGFSFGNAYHSVKDFFGI